MSGVNECVGGRFEIFSPPSHSLDALLWHARFGIYLAYLKLTIFEEFIWFLMDEIWLRCGFLLGISYLDVDDRTDTLGQQLLGRHSGSVLY